MIIELNITIDMPPPSRSINWPVQHWKCIFCQCLVCDLNQNQHEQKEHANSCIERLEDYSDGGQDLSCSVHSLR